MECPSLLPPPMLTAALSPSRPRFWFWLSLAIAAAYTIPVWQFFFSHPYTVQDDARQHVFWMARFLDPSLFPNDLIADYFQANAPWGYTTLYRGLALVGLEPLLVSQLLPPLLALVATGYGYWLCLELLPVPLAGAIASVLLNQVFWAHDDLASATPRAFLIPLFLAFLYYLVRRQAWPCLGAIVLQGLFYPQYVLVFAGILLLQTTPIQDFIPSLKENKWLTGWGIGGHGKTERWLWGMGLLVSLVVLLPYALEPSPYGPVITPDVARTLPEFLDGGRSRYFISNSWTFWLSANRSGLFPTLKPPLYLAGLALPLMLFAPGRFPLGQRVTPKGFVLLHIAITGVGLFLAAHALLFKLYLPSRYSGYTLRVALCFAAALSLTIALDALWRSPAVTLKAQGVRWGMTLCTAAALLLFPLYGGEFPAIEPIQGTYPRLYEFLSRQPRDTVIASLEKEADNLPTFARRTVLIAREYAIPYHVGYGEAFRQRVEDLIRAQYTPHPAVLQDFVQRYGVTVWLVGDDAFEPEFLSDRWTRQYPKAIQQAIRELQRQPSLVQQRSDRCTILAEDDLRLLSAPCLVENGEPFSQGAHRVR